MKYFKLTIIILTFSFLILLLLLSNHEANQISEIDNSKLPEASTIIDIDTFSKYLSKRIGLRSEFINLYTEMNDKLFGEMVHPTYKYGKDGYVFFKTTTETHDDSYIDAFAKLLKEMQQYVTDRGSYFLFVINPTKISIYEEYLPDGYIYTDYRVSYLKQKLEELNVNYIDNTEYLKEVTQDGEQTFNIKYDAGHWNDTGAFYGINAIYKKMIDDNIDISLLQKEDYDISYEHKDTLTVSKFSISDDVPEYNLKNKNYEYTKKYTGEINLSKKHSTYIETENSNPEAKYNMLFFRGSYMTGKEKFIAEHLKNVYYIHNYDNSINFDYYYNITKPDIVLFEAVEYAMNDVYYSRSDIMKKKYNVVYSKFENLPQKDFTKISLENFFYYIEKGENSALTEIRMPIINYKYAYLKIDDTIYDFAYENNTAYIAIDTEILKNGKLSVILINNDMDCQQITDIK